MRIFKINTVLILLIISADSALMASAKLLPKRFAFLNLDLILMMVIIMLQYLLKERRLNFIKHFILIWITV